MPERLIPAFGAPLRAAVAVDPSTHDDKMIVEFHRAGKETVAARTHVELTRDINER